MSAEWSEQPASGSSSNPSGAAAPSSNGVKGPGQILAEQRQALGWSVEQVADQLKLAVRQVVAIEAADYASLPPAAVVRGFVRAYAKVMRLDPAPLVAMIPLDTPVMADSAAASARREKAASMSQVRFSSSGARRRLPWGLIGGAVAVLALGVAAWQLAPLVTSYTQTAQNGADTAASAQGSASSAVLAPAESNGNVTELPSPVLGNPSVPLISVPPQSQPSAPGAGAVSASAPATPPAAGAAPATPATAPAPATPAAPAAATGGDALVLIVKEDSWVEVRRAKGRPLLSKMVKAGSIETVQIKEPVTLVVGKPGGVQATLRGNALALPPSGGGTVARVAVQ